MKIKEHDWKMTRKWTKVAENCHKLFFFSFQPIFRYILAHFVLFLPIFSRFRLFSLFSWIFTDLKHFFEYFHSCYFKSVSTFPVIFQLFIVQLFIQAIIAILMHSNFFQRNSTLVAYWLFSYVCSLVVIVCIIVRLFLTDKFHKRVGHDVIVIRRCSIRLMMINIA